MRAILLASATAASFGDLRLRSAVSQGDALPPHRTCWITAGACRKFLALTARQAWWSTLSPPVREDLVILNAIVEKLKRRSKDDFKGRPFEASLILQAVSWYLRYPLSYRDIEELFRERG